MARYFGGNGYHGDQETNDRIRCAIDEVSGLITPRGTYTLCPVLEMALSKKLIFKNGMKMSIPDCNVDPGNRFVVAAIGTLGDKLEKQCRQLASQGKIYESTLLDAVGTAMLDVLGEKICKKIEHEGKRLELLNGHRFAPGLENYPLEQQHLLFQIADNRAVDVFLNSSAIMMPSKSISFFLMLTKTVLKNKGLHKCSSCKMDKCQFRMGKNIK